ncbi:MAG: molybdenum cofactor guanylyltransferase [Pseudomonadota bacterium]
MNTLKPKKSECPVVILAGGKSSRFGRSKANTLLGVCTLIEHVWERLRVQTDGPIVINAVNAACPQIKEATYIADRRKSGLGPLAGLEAALYWAKDQGFDRVLTVPVDTPFLPASLIADLTGPELARYAMSAGRKHPIIGIWATCLSERLSSALEEGMRSAHAWIEHSQARGVMFEHLSGTDPFFNINTKEDLQRALSLLPVR